MGTSCYDESDLIYDLFWCKSPNISDSLPICSRSMTTGIGFYIAIRQKYVFSRQNNFHQVRKDFTIFTLRIQSVECFLQAIIFRVADVICAY
mgnify:FL=1